MGHFMKDLSKMDWDMDKENGEANKKVKLVILMKENISMISVVDKAFLDGPLVIPTKVNILTIWDMDMVKFIGLIHRTTKGMCKVKIFL